MKESSTYQLIWEEGEEVGLAKGMEKGLRLSLVTLLEQKFGKIPATLEEQIQLTTDAAKLQALIRQVLTITSVDELDLK